MTLISITYKRILRHSSCSVYLGSFLRGYLDLEKLLKMMSDYAKPSDNQIMPADKLCGITIALYLDPFI